MAEGVNSSFNREESTDAFERAKPTNSARRNKSTNPFDDSEEDVDDELFLQGSRKSGAESKKEAKYEGEILENKINEVRSETIASTERSLACLAEAGQVGDKIAETMAYQKEQLDNCNRKIDDINANLKNSRKHLRRIRSVFGGMRDFLLGTKMKKPPQTKPFERSGKSGAEEAKPSNPEAERESDSKFVYPSRNSGKFVGGDEKCPDQEQLIENNLGLMRDHVEGLKSRAIDIGNELDVQAELIDSINDQTEVAHISLTKQNKEIEKLLV
ncbi:Synaptosomal-associated protein [Nesidiocoris tenuis]|uniref:Synaptosomal-associated protein n=1 Tax=Nesidiocoris tenuis TaxID=355587 RepID=A0ABN7AY01_9HEMI|nr:Synaptosomal-associated protein [Nesidiocoris tenuis]